MIRQIGITLFLILFFTITGIHSTNKVEQIWGEDPSAKEYMELDTLTIKLDLKYLQAKYGYIKSGGFDADKFLYENLTKRGRAIRKNRKRAKARISYVNYVPTKEDHSKWYGKKKRIPKDTLTISADSMKNHFINTK